MNITPRHSGDEVISNDRELVDLQETEIKIFKSQQKTFFLFSRRNFPTAHGVIEAAKMY